MSKHIMALNSANDVPGTSVSEEDVTIHASHAYVLMKKKTRVSRNLRACWFFRHLNKTVNFTPLNTLEDLTEDLNLVSVIPQGSNVKLEHGKTYRVQIGPDTVITFLSSQYRLAFTLDLSPSLMSVDVTNGQFVFDGVFQSLSRCLRGLVKEFHIPGTDLAFSPDLYIAVICQTPVVCSSTNQVLVQGVKVNQENVEFYLKLIQFELNHFESALSVSFATLLSHEASKESFFHPDGDEDETVTEVNTGKYIGSPEAAFTNLLRYGILSLQLLPEKSSSGIVVITDGIVGLPNSFIMEDLLNQLRTHTIMCSFIKVGSPSGVYRKLGHIPFVELMQMIATATFGAYLSSGPDVTLENGEANVYHRAMLLWAFQKGLEGYKYKLTHYSDEDRPESISWIKKMLHRHPITGESFGTETHRKEGDKRDVQASLSSVLAVRLREGYTIKSVCFQKDNKEIHVKLQFPWRDYGRIEYAATSAWPLVTYKPVTHVEVTVEGSYDLLHEMLCKRTGMKKHGLRLCNIGKFWIILESISRTDQTLEHLQSFSSDPLYYQVPGSIGIGVPLFHLQQKETKLNTQLKQSEMEAFVMFWKEVIQLKPSDWQKWLHAHRIELILEHDRPFPRYFQVPNSSLRFTSIQCRQAQASLSQFLREWCTFVLAENNSYIKFLQHEEKKPPKSFCILKLTNKPPSMVIKMGFLGGTPLSVRSEELDLLREKIRNLHFPPRGNQKLSKKLASHASVNGNAELPLAHKSPLNKEGSEINCCVLLDKPVEKVCVVYETKPNDMTLLDEPRREMNNRQNQSAMWSVFRVLTHYLQHQRWVWNIQANLKAPVSMTSLSRLLATLTKLRLQEGFHFIVSGAGITNLVLEVDMKESLDDDDNDPDSIQKCILQYIIFPPHTKTSDDSMSEDDQIDNANPESEGEVQIVTECFVEPQYGLCCNNTPERQHFNGLKYDNLAKAFYQFDYECISSLVTFEHLVYLCECKAITSPDVIASSQSSPPPTPRHRFTNQNEESIRSEPTVNFISFPFDLMSLLPRSQQAEMLFSTFVIGDDNRSSQDEAMDPKGPNELLFSLFFDKLKESHDNETFISNEECERFIDHILERLRDKETNPVPFGYRPKHYDNAEEEDKDTDQGMSDSLGHKIPKRQEKPHTHTKPKDDKTDRHSRSTSKKHGFSGASAERKHSASRMNRSNSRNEFQDGKSKFGHCPMWKCFLKMENNEHVILSFVPASFDDLLLLNPTSADTTIVPNEQSEDQHSMSSTSQYTLSEKSGWGNGKQETQGQDNFVSPLNLKDSAPTSPENHSWEDRNETVQEWVNTSTHSMKPTVTGPLLIPVYVYSCQLKNIVASLIDRWTFALPEDIFEDKSFKPDSMDQRSPRLPMNQQRTSESTSDEQDRRSTDSSSYNHDSFRLHCCQLTDMYLSSFVSGVFDSLQHSYVMNRQDVDSAINKICEESHPIEMDLTTFLVASCTHMQNLIQKGKGNDGGGQEKLSAKGQVHKSVRFPDMPDSRDESFCKCPQILQLPKTSIDLENEELSSLCPDNCDLLKENRHLIASIRAKFAAAIKDYLSPIESLPDLYYYKPNLITIPTDEGDLKDNSGDSTPENDEDENNHEDEHDIIFSHENLSNVSMDSNHTFSDLGSFQSNISVESIESDPLPLFVHFTCTVKQKSNCQHTTVNNVPLCFGEITRGLTEQIPSIDFADFKVTLDINCLTLPNDDVDRPMPRKPSYVRSHSLNSYMSSEERDDDDEQAEKTSTIASSTLQPIGDPIVHLPVIQYQSINNLKKEIEWLLQEEVISALRRTSPITGDTLAFVAEHIFSAADLSETSLHRKMEFQFVHASESCMTMFLDELKHQQFPGYKFVKEGEYYYMALNSPFPNKLKFVRQLSSISQRLEVTPDSDDDHKLPDHDTDLHFESPNTIDEVTAAKLSELQINKPSDVISSNTNEFTNCQPVSSSEVIGSSSYQETAEQEQRHFEMLDNLQSQDSSTGTPRGTSLLSKIRHPSASSCHTNGSSRLSSTPSLLSGRNSFADDEFEADVNDNECDDTTSMSDMSYANNELPDFWLLLKIQSEKVKGAEVFFHSRECVEEDLIVKSKHGALFSSVIDCIHRICRKVNQTLLLKDLVKTRICNPLLVPEADEDVSWTSQTASNQSMPYASDDDEDSGNTGSGVYLYKGIKHGHFACEIVWRHHFAIHTRLKPCVQRGGPSMGVLALRSILNNFSIKNRRNMFVIQEHVSRNVFYVRMKEVHLNQDVTEFDAEGSLSGSTGHGLMKYDTHSYTELDTVSLASSHGRASHIEDAVELTVHGIEEAGKEVKDDLMKMLQNKLDEALLENISVMLSRNPQCKLKAEDIYFIQCQRQSPTKALHMTIPGHVSMYLVALMYYLRQNLLQFLNTPNYIDSNPGSQFQDVYDGVCLAIPSEKVYVYNRPQCEGSKGLACISVQLVDGTSHQVKLLHCPCPTRDTSLSLNDFQEFEDLVQTNEHEITSTTGPGPTALVQFHIWECGNCDVKALGDKLSSAVRHALCDIVMEYFVLTAPICNIPKHLLDMSAVPVSSLPASPHKVPYDPPEKHHNLLIRKMSIDPPKTLSHLPPALMHFDRVSSSEGAGRCLDFSSGPPSMPDQHSLPRTPLLSQSKGQLHEDLTEAKLHQQKIMKYESGETGSLHFIFCSLIVPWLTFCSTEGVPSVSRIKFLCRTKFSVDFVLKELQQSIPSLSNDTSLKIYKVVTAPNHSPCGVPFFPCKKQQTKEMQLPDYFPSSSSKVTLLAVGRNLEQWQFTVLDNPDAVPGITTAQVKGYRASQRFLPQVAPQNEGSTKNLDQSGQRSSEKMFVPRQKLIIILCEKREMNLYLYNWASDMASQIEKIVTRLVQWHNARTHVLDSIVGQKMGLYHHFAFSDLNYTMAQNPFTQSSEEVDSLIRLHAPSKDYKRRHSSLSSKERERAMSRPFKRIVSFDMTYKNFHPPKFIYKLKCNASSDPICRHACQALELRMHSRQDKQALHPGQAPRKEVNDEKILIAKINDPVFQHGFQLNDTQKFLTEEEERRKLHELYIDWSSGVNFKNQSNLPGAEYLQQLKRAGRLFHYCATPLVFSSKWRHNVVQRMSGRAGGSKSEGSMSGLPYSIASAAMGVVSSSSATTPATPDKSHRTRSRHSSGTSNVSVKGKSGDPLDIGRKSSASEQGGQGNGSHRRWDVDEEEQWHTDLLHRFLKEYEQYLTSELGFIKLTVQSNLNARNYQSTPAQTPDSCSSKRMAIHLQKTLAGGIIVMEICFRQEYFCVNMFAIDSSQLQICVNQQMQLIFLDECEKYKDLIHVHSFAHDFHLRCVQGYLRPQGDSVFPEGFELDKFLSDFKQIYPYPPSFSQNCLHEDNVILSKLPFPGHMLYDNMLKQMGFQNMRVFHMGDKFALVQHTRRQLENLAQKQTDDLCDKLSEWYDVSLVIINNCPRFSSADLDQMTLSLKHFTVLSRERDCYPMLTLDKAVSGFRKGSVNSNRISSGEVSLDENWEKSKPVAVKQHIGMRKEHINYRGQSNAHHCALEEALFTQSDNGKVKIKEMVTMSEMKCRRDYLWHRLQTNNTDLEESTETLLPLNYDEFRELLKIVKITPFCEVDPQLTTLFHMPATWYPSLFAAMKKVYPDTHRCFSSPNETKKYVVVLFLDMFVMLSIDDAKQKTELNIVMKEPLMNDWKHTPENPNSPLYNLQTHVEDFVNFCGHHIWVSML